MSLSDNLRFYRKKFGLSQEQIAKRLGYKSFTTIQKWESGVSTPSIEVLSTLANIFGISLDRLTGEAFISIIEARAEELGVSLDDLAEQTGISREFFEKIDSCSPDPWDYEKIPKIAKALNIEDKVLYSALARQEPPSYEGPPIPVVEDFADVNEQAINNGYFRIMQDAKQKGIPPEDISLALSFLEEARKRNGE